MAAYRRDGRDWTAVAVSVSSVVIPIRGGRTVCLSLPATSWVPGCCLKCTFLPRYRPSTQVVRLPITCVVCRPSSTTTELRLDGSDVDVDGDGLEWAGRRVAPQKRSKSSRSHSPAQPSPGRAHALACAQAATGPCPDLPVLSLPSRLPCLLPSILRQPSILPFPLCSDRKKAWGSRPKPNEAGAQSQARGRTTFILFPFDGVLARSETKAAKPYRHPPPPS